MRVPVGYAPVGLCITDQGHAETTADKSDFKRMEAALNVLIYIVSESENDTSPDLRDTCLSLCTTHQS